MPPDVRPTASHGCRSVTSAATGWSVCRSRTRAEPLVADRATWSSLVDDALRTDARLQIRCLDAAVPTTDTRLVRAEEAVAFTTLVRPCRRSTGHQVFRPAEHGHRGPERRARRRGHRDGRRPFYHRLHVSLRKYKFRLLAQPFALFERIWQEFAVHDGIVTLLAHVNGEPVAGAVYLAWNDVLYYKFGASLPRTLPLRPNDALAWTALRWASERGFRLLDWGLSDLDQPGLIAYKRKWASQERRIVTLRSISRELDNNRDAGQLLGELTCLLTEDAVPDHITERAGCLLYRYFA